MAAKRDSQQGKGLSEEERLDLAERVTDHHFSDRDLLRRALTHPSVEQAEPLRTYERLEFLGDAVVSFVVSDMAYDLFPDLREGELTRIRIGAVAGTTLSEVARELGLDQAVDIGNREMRETGRGIESALENAFEALVAALYLDAGLDVARQFVVSALEPFIRPDMVVPEHPKSALMSWPPQRANEPRSTSSRRRARRTRSCSPLTRWSTTRCSARVSGAPRSRPRRSPPRRRSWPSGSPSRRSGNGAPSPLRSPSAVIRYGGAWQRE